MACSRRADRTEDADLVVMAGQAPFSKATTSVDVVGGWCTEVAEGAAVRTHDGAVQSSGTRQGQVFAVRDFISRVGWMHVEPDRASTVVSKERGQAL